MSETEVKEKEVKTNAGDTTPEVQKDATKDTAKGTENSPRQRMDRPMKGGRMRRPNARHGRKSEYEQKILAVRRVTRVVAGGRRFSLSAVIVIGDRKGKVGIGIGKSTDVAQAVKKASDDAKKKIKVIPLTKNASISREVSGKYCASRVMLFPSDSGIVAGGAVRVIADLAGIRNIKAKFITRSKNQLNNAHATLKALEDLKNQSHNNNIK